jgi:dTDP-4-dehydrorhamnose 3,5-epimerase
VKFVSTDLPGVVIAEPQVFRDERGFFMETWHAGKFADAGIDETFVQDNHTRSAHGVLRGMHIQLRHSQGKLVRVAHGVIFDVAVDLRTDSTHFGKWTGHILSEENQRQLWIPQGFAHGFYVVSESADVMYKCTEFYSPENERTLQWNDPDVGIRWPLSEGQLPLLSAKDAKGLTLRELRPFLS